jgi:hypothetical protein
MNTTKTPNKLKLLMRNISTDIKQYNEKLRYYNDVYDKFAVVQKFAFVIAFPASILYSIKCAYDDEIEKVKEGRRLHNQYYFVGRKFENEQEYYESIVSSHIYKSSVSDFITSFIDNFVTEGIPLYLKISFFYIYAVNYIIVKAINRNDENDSKNTKNTKNDE